MRRVILLLKPLLLLGILAVSGCDRQAQQASSLELIQQRGSLRVGTLYHPLYYFLRDGQEEGLDFELAQLFSRSLGDNIALKMVPAYSLDELFALLDSGQVDMLAAGLTNTELRRTRYRFGPSYYHIEHTLAYRKGGTRPKRIQALSNDITVLAGSSQAEWLYEQQQADPELSWQAQRDTDPEDLLRQVAENKVNYALVSDILLARTQRYYPSIEAAFTVGEPQAIAWALPKDEDDSLLAAMLTFFELQSGSGTLAQLHEKYFGHVQSFDYVDTRTFLQRINNRLPQYQPLFERYAGELDWRLLAAMSYQESHWDPKATSYTGVRGMMMLTEDTAAHVGVTNRLDPEQSIRGGAQYLTSILARLPDAIPKSERIWFALAAYNIGLGHILDVRRLTQSRQQDPNSWAQVKANLPLLHQPKWYRKTRYGYARGRETKQFVNNIRQYYQSLLWQDNVQTDASLATQVDASTSENDI